MINNNIRYSLKTDGILDLDDLWDDAIEKHGTIPKGENPKKPEKPNKPLRSEENIMDKIKLYKKHIFVAVYAFFIIIELFFYVPYNSIQVFRSQQNVPHTEIIGSGYATMTDITNDNAYVQKQTATGKIVNTQQLFINVSITTILAVGIYFIFLHEKKNVSNDS